LPQEINQPSVGGIAGSVDDAREQYAVAGMKEVYIGIR
jgi:hypothetical protein